MSLDGNRLNHNCGAIIPINKKNAIKLMAIEKNLLLVFFIIFQITVEYFFEILSNNFSYILIFSFF